MTNAFLIKASRARLGRFTTRGYSGQNPALPGDPVGVSLEHRLQTASGLTPHLGRQAVWVGARLRRDGAHRGRGLFGSHLMSPPRPWLIGVQANNTSAVERDRIAQLLQGPIRDHGDWILLSTCHRVEVYGFGAAPQLNRNIRAESGESAVRHLMRVAAGLESAIIGEDEVLHQVREALARTRASRALDNRLGRMFETAIAAGRLARAERMVGGGNLAQRAVTWLGQRSELAGGSVLIAGAGRMGSALAHAARLAGSEVTIASRNPARAQRLARLYGGRGVDLASGAEIATKSAAVAVALAGMWQEFRPDDAMLPPIADISAPPAVLASIRSRLNGDFLGIDDLYTRTRPVPSAYIEKAEQIVEIKTREFAEWLERRA